MAQALPRLRWLRVALRGSRGVAGGLLVDRTIQLSSLFHSYIHVSNYNLRACTRDPGLPQPQGQRSASDGTVCFATFPTCTRALLQWRRRREDFWVFYPPPRCIARGARAGRTPDGWVRLGRFHAASAARRLNPRAPSARARTYRGRCSERLTLRTLRQRVALARLNRPVSGPASTGRPASWRSRARSRPSAPASLRPAARRPPG